MFNFMQIAQWFAIKDFNRLRSYIFQKAMFAEDEYVWMFVVIICVHHSPIRKVMANLFTRPNYVNGQVSI